TCANGGIASLRKMSRRRFLEAGILFGGLVAVSFIVFYKIESEADSALLYLPLPFLLWAAVRFGSRGLTAGVCIVAFLTIWGAAHGHGPFSEKSPEANALSV